MTPWLARPLRLAIVATALLTVTTERAHPQQTVVCEQALQSLEQAIATRDRTLLEQKGFDIGGLPGCDPDEVRAKRRQAARILAEVAQTAAQAGASSEEIQRRYVNARRVASVEPVLRGMAELAYAQKNWTEAARDYSDLLMALQDPEPDDPPTPAGSRVMAFQRASETQMLAPLGTAGSRIARDGTPSGLDAVLIPNGSRSLGIRQRMLPVTFEFDSAEMTRDGKTYFESWWNAVRGGVSNTLVLAGHTDPRGTDARNEVLALNRAAAMATFLQQHGFAGRLLVVGFGRRCPVELSAGSTYSLEDQFQIFRRVEVIADELPPAYCGGAKPTMPPPSH
jgi:outer membrane protein OmpA-like peptidoglycan-associated protein